MKCLYCGKQINSETREEFGVDDTKFCCSQKCKDLAEKNFEKTKPNKKLIYVLSDVAFLLFIVGSFVSRKTHIPYYYDITSLFLGIMFFLMSCTSLREADLFLWNRLSIKKKILLLRILGIGMLIFSVTDIIANIVA